MKKWLIVFLIFLFVFILSVYFFIPAYIAVGGVTSIPATKDGLYRNLTSGAGWTKWWPGTYENHSNTAVPEKFIFNNTSYTIDEIRTSSILISITKNSATIKTSLNVFPGEHDTLKLLWQGFIYTSFNPVKRLQVYMESKKVNRDMNGILEKMRTHFSKKENIYGFNVHEEYILDSIFIFKDATSKGFPQTAFVYGIINELKNYIQSKSARETGYPMLNIYTNDSINYTIKVAIPVDKMLPTSGSITYRTMPAGGNILGAEVKGGYSVINAAFNQLKNYADDYHHIAPAIPYQSLVTDRSKEPDSSKWITRVYHPIMY